MSVQAQRSPAFGLWPSVWKLLRLRVLIFISGFRHAKVSRKIGIIFLGVLFLAFLGFLFFLSWVLLRFLRSPQLGEFVGEVDIFLESVPVLIVGGAFLGILLTSFGVLLQALYLSGDMDFLLSAPVPIRAVFITKMLQAVLPNFGLVCLFSLPVLYGLGVVGGYTFVYFPLVLVVLAALALSAAGLSSLLVMFVVRIVPARRAAELLGFIGAVTSFLCSQSGQLANFEDFSDVQAGNTIRFLERFNTPWSPLAWAGRALVDVGEGRWLAGGGFLVLSVGLAVVVFGLALTTAERLYYAGWASMQNNQRKKKLTRPGRSSAPPLVTYVAGRIPAAMRAIILKDYFVLRRDLRNMSHLVTPLIFGIVYAIMFLRTGGQVPAGRGEAPAVVMAFMQNLMVYGNVGISLFVSWMLLGRLAGMGFSQEGKSYWVLKTAPVSVFQLLAAKFLVAYLPALILGWVFLLVISFLQPGGLSTLWFTLPVVALCIGGVAGINLAFGIAGANMNWDDPRHMQKGSSSCLGGLASIIYLPVSLFLFFAPPLGLPLLGVSTAIGQLAGLALGGVFCLGGAAVPLLLVRRRIPRLGES